MDTNRGNMNDLFTTYKTSFMEGFQNAGNRMGPEDFVLNEIAMVGPVMGAGTTHAWLEQIGGMVEWIGPRIIRNLTTGKLYIVNRKFVNTVAVEVDDIEDDNYGLYLPRFNALGYGAEALWAKLAIDAFTTNGKWADGKPFFAANRKYGKNDVVNTADAALSAESYADAKEKMESFMLQGDEPGEVVIKYLLVGPHLRNTAWNILKNEFVAAGDNKGSIKNPNQGTCELRISRRLVGAHADKWYLVGEQNGVKPVFVQQRRKGVLVRKDKAEDDNVFFDGKALYGTDARGEAFLTLPHLAFAGLPA